MFFLRSPMRLIGFAVVASILFMLGPDFADFSSESMVEFTTFYVNLSVIVLAGLFMRGHVNQRTMIVLGTAFIANHYLFYAYLFEFQQNIYARFWTMFVSTLPMYFAFNYYTFLQCKCLSLLQKLGVKDETADKLVGPIGTTNMTLTFNFYATMWLVIDFCLASYATIFGLAHGMGPTESIVGIFAATNHINLFTAYDSLIILVDAVFTVVLAHRLLLDQKRPDALGLGRSMTWDKSRSIRSQVS